MMQLEYVVFHKMGGYERLRCSKIKKNTVVGVNSTKNSLSSTPGAC